MQPVKRIIDFHKLPKTSFRRRLTISTNNMPALFKQGYFLGKLLTALFCGYQVNSGSELL